MVERIITRCLNNIIATPIQDTPTGTFTREIVFSNEDGDVFILVLQSRDLNGIVIDDREIAE